MKCQPLFFAFFVAISFFACKNQPDAEVNEGNQPEKINIQDVRTDAPEEVTTSGELSVENEELPDNQIISEDLPEKVKTVNNAPAKNEKPAAVPVKEENKETIISEKTADPVTKPEPVETIPAKPSETPSDKAETVEETPTPDEPAVIEEPKVDKPAPPPAFSHDIWDGLTRKYVSSTGKVNYTGFKKDIGQLDAYLALLKANPPSGSRSAQLAYWINVYNAYTVKMIADNYPVSSITKLHGGQPWQVRWVEVNGKTYTLDEVENAVIRPKFKDARIHFAVNCAAKSCPPLLNRAWTESNLERYLESQTRKFINDPAHNQIKSNSAQLSKIFEWYAVDFGDIITYINKYSDVKVKPGSPVTYNEYDWSLND